MAISMWANFGADTGFRQALWAAVSYKMGDFPSAHLSVHLSPKGPSTRLAVLASGLTCWLGLMPGWLGFRPSWLGLRPGWLGHRAGWLGLRPGWLGLRPGWMALKGGTDKQTNQ